MRNLFMRYVKFPALAFISLLFFLPSVFASARLTMPNNTELLAINGQKASEQSPVKLQSGLQQVVFKFYSVYRQRGERIQFASEAMVLTFEAGQNDYHLKLPTISSARAEKAFNAQPKLSLTDGSNQPVTFKLDVLSKTGLQIGRDYQQEIRQYNGQNRLASVAQFGLSYAAPAIDTVAVKQTAPIKQLGSSTKAIKSTTEPVNMSENVPIKTIEQDQAEVLQMLQYWYGRASTATQNTFKQSIESKK